MSSTLLTVAPMSVCITHERSQGSHHTGTARCTPLPAEVLLGVLGGLISVVSQPTPWTLPLSSLGWESGSWLGEVLLGGRGGHG